MGANEFELGLSLPLLRILKNFYRLFPYISCFNLIIGQRRNTTQRVNLILLIMIVSIEEVWKSARE